MFQSAAEFLLNGLYLLLALAQPAEPLPAPRLLPEQARWRGAETELDALIKDAENVRDPLALAKLLRVWNWSHLLGRAPLLPFLDKLIREPSAPPLLVDHARALQAERLRELGKFVEANALSEPLGLMTAGLMIGPFPNAAGAGHDELYPPEQGITEPVRGKSHQVRWRSFAGLAPHGTLELSRVLHPGDEGTAYVAVGVEVPKNTLAALRVGATDQLKVLLNGQTVRSVDTRRRAAMDQESIPVVLVKGKNLLLLKTSWLEQQGRLAVRITAPQGGPLPLRWLTTPEELFPLLAQPPAYVAAKHSVRGLLDGFEASLAKAKGAAKAQVLSLRADVLAIADLYDRRQLPSPPEQDLDAAIRADPGYAAARFFFAHRVAARDPTLTHEQLAAALAVDPQFSPARIELAQLAKGAGRILEARDHLDASIQQDATFFAAHVARASLGVDALSEGPLALRRLTAIKNAEQSASLLTERSRLERSFGLYGAARASIKAALAQDATRSPARAVAIELALDARDLDRAISLLEQSLQLQPYELEHHLRLARILHGDPARASKTEAIMARAKAWFPDDPQVARLEAELALFAKDTKTALLALDRALELDPHQPELRQHRRALSGEKGEIEDEYSIDATKLAGTPATKEEARWGAVYLAERTAARLYENGKSTRFRQSILRLYNPELKNALRVHRISYSPSRETVEILSAERIRPSGEIIKASRVDDQGQRGKVSGMYLDQRTKLIVFDELAAGDLIHLRYRVDSLGNNIFGGFFGDLEGLQSTLPKRQVMYAASSPKSVALYPGGIRVPAPERSESNGYVTSTWRFDQIAAIEPEPSLPPYPQLGMMVGVSTYATWDDLGRWYARLYSEQLGLDDEARAAGKKAILGAKNDDEKIAKLYAYVVKNTRYVGIELGIHGWKPFKAAEVHRRRYGDCKDKATLLSALLRDNGIDATITLVRTADRGQLPPEHATMWAFNHAITYVPSRDLFLDPTAEFSGVTELPWQDQGAQALIVHPDGKTKLVTIPQQEAKAHLNQSEYTVTVDRSTGVTLSGTEHFWGARASQLRQELEAPETRKTLLERQLGQTYGGAAIESLEFSDLSDLEAPVHYRYVFRLPRWGRLEGQRYQLPVAFFNHQVASAYAQLANRKHSLFTNHPWSTRNVLRYQLPAGSKIEALPEGLTIQTKHISLVQVVRPIPGGFETDDTVTLSSREIPPEDYAAFREACLAIDRAMARKVVIQW